MKNDYFKTGNEPIVDKSNWFASVNMINPILNGGIATYMFDFNYEQERFVGPKEGGKLRDMWFITGCKIFSIVNNLVVKDQTLNKQRENVKKVLRSVKHGDKEEMVWEMDH